MTDAAKQGHPRSLYTLFFAEMWERFSFYGMRALLTLYLTLELFKDMANNEPHAFGIYAAYGALVYATPYLGGLIADKFLGYQKSTMLGAVLMSIGHIVMAVENEFFLYIALAFLIVGNGMFKPNISSMVGGLYEEGDPRRDSGFTIFYMGINLGALLAPLTCGWLGENVGWSYGFGLAGIGMIAGLFVFNNGRARLGDIGKPPFPEKLKQKIMGISKEWLIYILVFLSVGFFALAVRYYHFTETVVPYFSVGVMVLLLIQSFMLDTKVAMQRVWAILILLVFTTFFWAFFEQAGSSITLFTNENVDRRLFGWDIPASTFQSVNPSFIVLLGPLFSMLWLRLAKANVEPNTPVKMGFGMILLGLGFYLFVVGQSFLGVNGNIVLVPLIFLVLGYLIQTCGELALSPVGLSMVTKLAPKHMVANVMGAWFLSSALGHILAGFIAKSTKEGTVNAVDFGILEAGEVGKMDATLVASYDNLAGYLSTFQDIALYSIGLGVLLLLLSPLVKKLMNGVH